MKKILFLGAVAVLLSLGLVLVSCSSCPGDGNCKVSAEGADYKWCGDSVTDLSDAETAVGCAVYKAFITTGGEIKAAECDC